VFYPDFEELIASFNAHRVRYLVVGAYAVAFHARPRATKDIDILVDATPANAKRVIAALSEFLGTPMRNVTIEKLTNPRTLIVLGASPVRIDVLTSIDGVPSFAAAWRRRAQGRFGESPTQYLSLDDLIAAKHATPATRVQDKADLVQLQRIRARQSRK
jgi:hypothetical protein